MTDGPPTWRHAVSFDRPHSTSDEKAAKELLREWGEARGLTPIRFPRREGDYDSKAGYGAEFIGERTEPTKATRLTGYGREYPAILSGCEERLPHD